MTPTSAAALVEAMTWGRVFPNDKASNRDLAVFAATSGHIKRMLAAVADAERRERGDRMTEPEVIEPDTEPVDDSDAEVPDVREDTVPDD